MFNYSSSLIHGSSKKCCQSMTDSDRKPGLRVPIKPSVCDAADIYVPNHTLQQMHTPRYPAMILIILMAVSAVFYTSVAEDTSQIAKSRIRRQNGLPFPTFHNIPDDLSFTCSDKVPGYYSDLETECQAWHWCTPHNQHWTFLCPNHTVFNQRFRVCDWWYNVRCDDAVNFYNINEDLYKVV